ncbi:TolB family protein [Hymenobacter rubidus]|uniref:TolB family protein n=1 Tax=Hymenobacter rubidus TaxID=1441626 RepID=UPI00191D2F87|nr:PD40 domain-containing protein [Hymenobacter rubidus]
MHNYANDMQEYSFTAKTNTTFKTAGNDPVRLADGSTLYVNKAFSGARLEVTNAAGNQVRVIYNSQSSASAISNPKISPDGSKVAFTYTEYYNRAPVPFSYGTVVMDLNGNYLAGAEGYFSPAWLPDGRLVMAGDYDSNINFQAPATPSAKAGLYIGTIAGTGINVSRVAAVASNPTPILPSVSPDGTRIAFVQNTHLWLVNTDGTGLRALTTASGSQEGHSVWSPDGKYVAFWTYKTFEQSYYTALGVVPATGTGPVALENSADIWPRNADGNRISGGWGGITWL